MTCKFCGLHSCRQRHGKMRRARSRRTAQAMFWHRARQADLGEILRTLGYAQASYA